jgi:type VI secretion system protein ImpA
MESAPTLDLEALLVPIPGEKPAGESVRYAGAYDTIQEARRADEALAQGEWKREVKTADWPRVVAVATEVLAAKSKDLQIAAWLAEALIKLHGFPGLRDGLCLLRELQERYWEVLFPPIEEGDLESRSALLEWLNEKLPPSLRAIPLTRSRDGDSYSWLHWEESRTVDNLGRQNPEAMQALLAEGKISGEQFDKAVTSTPRAYYETLSEDLNRSWEECGRLEGAVDEKYGRDAPSLLNIKKALEDCRGLVADIVKKKRELEPDATTPQPAVKPDSPVPRRREPRMASSPSLESVPFAPQDRSDALNRLAAVADFFRQTEPHSPVSYLVQRAVQWGQMPLEEWLKDVISDDAVLARVRETLGLKDQEPEKSG